MMKKTITMMVFGILMIGLVLPTNVAFAKNITWDEWEAMGKKCHLTIDMNFDYDANYPEVARAKEYGLIVDGHDVCYEYGYHNPDDGVRFSGKIGVNIKNGDVIETNQGIYHITVIPKKEKPKKEKPKKEQPKKDKPKEQPKQEKPKTDPKPKPKEDKPKPKEKDEPKEVEEVATDNKGNEKDDKEKKKDTEKTEFEGLTVTELRDKNADTVVEDGIYYAIAKGDDGEEVKQEITPHVAKSLGYEEEIVETTEVEEVKETTTEKGDEEKGSRTWIVFVVIIGILVIVGGVYYIIKRKKG